MDGGLRLAASKLLKKKEKYLVRKMLEKTGQAVATTDRGLLTAKISGADGKTFWSRQQKSLEQSAKIPLVTAPKEGKKRRWLALKRACSLAIADQIAGLERTATKTTWGPADIFTVVAKCRPDILELIVAPILAAAPHFKHVKPPNVYLTEIHSARETEARLLA
jgi:hypothetical protein